MVESVRMRCRSMSGIRRSSPPVKKGDLGIVPDTTSRKLEAAYHLLGELIELANNKPEIKAIILPVAKSLMESLDKIEQQGLRVGQVAEFVNLLLKELTDLRDLVLGTDETAEEMIVILSALEGAIERGELKGERKAVIVDLIEEMLLEMT